MSGCQSHAAPAAAILANLEEKGPGRLDELATCRAVADRQRHRGDTRQHRICTLTKPLQEG
jgi:hypothetical protein